MSNEQDDLHVKFKALKHLIKGWNSQQGDIKDRIESLEGQIKEMDQLQQLNVSQYKCKMQKEKDLSESYSVWDGMLKQRSRLNWALQGDANTWFFHNYVKYR